MKWIGQHRVTGKTKSTGSITTGGPIILQENLSGQLGNHKTIMSTSALTLKGTNGVAGNIVLDASNDIYINADGGEIIFQDDSATLATIDTNGLSFIDNTGAGVRFEGSTDDANNTVLLATDPTGARICMLPDASGTLALTTDTSPYIQVRLNRDDIYVLYLNSRTYWYSVSGSAGYTGELNVSAGNWTSWSDDRQARHAGYVATSACKVNKVRFVGLFSTSYTSGALDFEFAIQKWTPGNDTTSTVTTTHMTHTDHDGSYTEGRIYNLEFVVTGNNTLAAGDAFSLFARCNDSNASARLQLWYGGCNAEIELT